MSSLYTGIAADDDDKKVHYKRSPSNASETLGSITTSATTTHHSSNNNSSSLLESSIWSRLLTSESIWDSLNVVDNEDGVYDGNDDYYMDDDDDHYTTNNNNDDDELKWYHLHMAGISLLCLTAWYELRHFLRTVAAHPHIWLTSLVVAGAVAGVGMWAIAAEKDAYVQDKMQTAAFVARETATYFSNEFKRAFLPLYSLREAVTHSGHFDDLADRIGRYPHLRMGEENVVIPGGMANYRNVSGICDGEEVLEKWDELVSTSTSENDLDGMIVRYRLMPRNVACLEYKMNQATMDDGMDMSNSAHPFWTMVTTDLFLKRWKGLHAFGPFMAGDKETFCTHLAIWVKPKNRPEWVTREESGGGGVLSLENIRNSFTTVHDTEVENVWGFVMNYLDWGALKDRSKIHERFANVRMDFELTRREEDVDPNLSGPKGEPTNHFALLARSEKSHLLDESNSILIETESLHGIWQNRVGIVLKNGWNPEWWPAAVASVVIIAILLSLLTASTLVKSQLHRDLTEKMMPKKAIKKLHRGQTVIEKYNLVTILYIDVVGFSSKAGRMMSPTQVMNTLNDLYTELDKIADRHGVYKVETVGNRYMVVGGAPKQVSARVAAKRVALFAIDAMAFVDRMFLTTTGSKLNIRAGMASGPAVAGCVGKAMPRYCFFGETVDRASRIEKTSKKNMIQCSEVTYRLLNDGPGMKFVMTPRIDMEIIKDKGLHSAYWIEKASPCENCFELTKGSWILDTCGHVLCAECNAKHNLNVCPTCRCKVVDRTEWQADVGPNKIMDIDDASFVLEAVESDDSAGLEAAESGVFDQAYQ